MTGRIEHDDGAVMDAVDQKLEALLRDAQSLGRTSWRTVSSLSMLVTRRNWLGVGRANSSGMTCHTMAAVVTEATAVKALNMPWIA